MPPSTPVWRRFPPRKVAADRGVWTTVYQLDLTDMGSGKNTDWRTAGDSASVTLDGGYGQSAAWLAHAESRTQAHIVAAAGVCKLEHTTGLHLSCVSGPNMYASDTSAIKVVAKITDLVSGMSPADTVCVQLRANAHHDPLIQPNSNDIAHFGMYIGRLSNTQTAMDWGKNCTLLQNLGGGSDIYVNHNQGQTGVLWERTGGSNNADYYEAIFYPQEDGGVIKLMTGDWTGAFPHPDAGYTAESTIQLSRSTNGNTATSINLALADIYVGFYGGQGNVTGADIPLYSAFDFRVLKLDS